VSEEQNAEQNSAPETAPDAAEAPPLTQDQIDAGYLGAGHRQQLINRFNERLSEKNASSEEPAPAAEESPSEASAAETATEAQLVTETPPEQTQEDLTLTFTPEQQAQLQTHLNRARETTDEAERLKNSYLDLQSRMQTAVDSGNAHQAFEMLGLDMAKVVREQLINAPSDEDARENALVDKIVQKVEEKLVNPLQTRFEEDKTQRAEQDRQQNLHEYLQSVANCYGTRKDELPHLAQYSTQEICNEVYRRAVEIHRTGQKVDNEAILKTIHEEQKTRFEEHLKRLGIDPAKITGTASEAQSEAQQASPASTTGPTLTNAGSNERGDGTHDFLNRKAEKRRLKRVWSG
jgi:hypothetical protein